VPLDLARLIEEHHAPVYRFAYRLTGSVPDAEDLTQQVFLIAHQKLDQIRDPASARGWLFTVLRRCFLKNCRRMVPTPASSVEVEMEHVPEELTVDEIDRELLQRALDQLPDEFRLVLLMFYFEECSYREIAEKLELPLGTVMSRLSRAKRALRRRLLPQEVGVVVDKSRSASAESE
jgi:RNA polymerase sigma-70 factor (ECF subfamily)